MDDVLNVGFTDLFEVYPVQQHSHTGVQYSYLEKRTTASGRVTFNSNSERLHLIKVSDPNLQLLQCALVKEHTWDHVGFCFRAHTTIREGYNYQARLITEVERVEPGLETLYKLSLERLPFITPSGHTSNSVMLVGWFVKWDEILDDRSANAVHSFNSLLSLLRGTENDASPFLFRGAASPGSHSIPAGVHLFVSRVFDIGKPDSNRPKNRSKQDSSLGVTKSSSGRVSKHTAYSSKLTEGLLASQQAVQNGARNSPLSASSAVPVKQQYTPPVLRPPNAIPQPASPKHSRDTDLPQYAGYNKMLQHHDQQQQKQREQQKHQQQREGQQREQTMQQLCGRDGLIQRCNSPYSQSLHTGPLYSHHSLQTAQLHHTSIGLPPAGYPGPEQMLSAHYPASHALWSPTIPEQLPLTLQHPVLHPVPSRSTDTPSPTSIPSGNDGKGSGATSSLTTSNSGGGNLPLNIAGRPSSNSPASPIGQIEPYTSTSNSFSSYAGLPGDASPQVRIDHHISHLEDAYLSHYGNGELDMEALVAHEVLLRQQQQQQQQQHVHGGLHGYMTGRTSSPAIIPPLVPSDFSAYPSLKGAELDTDVLYDSINPTFVNVRSVSRGTKSPLTTPDKSAARTADAPQSAEKSHVSTPPAKLEPVSKAKPMAVATYSPCISPPSKSMQRLLPGAPCYLQVPAPGTPVATPVSAGSVRLVATSPGSPIMHSQQTVIGLPVQGPLSPGTYPASPVPASPPMMAMPQAPYGIPLQYGHPQAPLCATAVPCPGTPTPTKCASPLVQYVQTPPPHACCGCGTPSPNHLRRSLDTVEDYKALDYLMPTPKGNPESDIDPADIPEGIGNPSSSDESIFTPTRGGRYTFTLSPPSTSPPGGRARLLFAQQGHPRVLSHDIVPKLNFGVSDAQPIKQQSPASQQNCKTGGLLGKLTPFIADICAADADLLSKYKTYNTTKHVPNTHITPTTPHKTPASSKSTQQDNSKAEEEEEQEDEFFDASEEDFSPGIEKDSRYSSDRANLKAVKVEKLEQLPAGLGAIPASYDHDCLAEPQQCASPRLTHAAQKYGKEGMPPDLLMCSAPDLHLAVKQRAVPKSDTEDESLADVPVLYEKLLEQGNDPFKPQRLIRSTSFASRMSRLWLLGTNRPSPRDGPIPSSQGADSKAGPEHCSPADVGPPVVHADVSRQDDVCGQPGKLASGVKAEVIQRAGSPLHGSHPANKGSQVGGQAAEQARLLRRSAIRKMLQDSGTIQDAKVLGLAESIVSVQPTIVVPVKNSPPKKDCLVDSALGAHGGVRAAVQSLIQGEVKEKRLDCMMRKTAKPSHKERQQNVPPTMGANGLATKQTVEHVVLREAYGNVCGAAEVLQAISTN